MKPVGYFKFAILSDELKVQHKIKIGATIPRYDCTDYSGNYTGLDAFKNKKGMLYLNLFEAREIIKANDSRKAEFVLKGNNLNFTSLYFENPTIQDICFGYPNGKILLSNGQKNPLFIYRKDLYIILLNEHFTEFEVFIFENCKPYASDYLQECIQGSFEDVFEELRAESKKFYNY